jgi:glutaconate CoA-transferase, subunit B
VSAPATSNEMMIVASARQLAGERVCFVGVGPPNIACNLAKRTISPDLELIYEAGVFGAVPARLPLSIGDPTLVTGSLQVTNMFELFAYFLEGGLVDVGFLGASQIDRHGNINTTVIGDYFHPKTRLPGGGGAPEIATSSKEIYITMAQTKRGMVEKIDFVTSFGHGEGGDHRQRLGIETAGPTLLITDLAIWRPDPVTKEFTVVSLHPGVTRQQVQESCGWVVKFAEALDETPAPSELELTTLRDLQARTKAAHEGTGKTRAV